MTSSRPQPRTAGSCLLDAASLGGADHATALHISTPRSPPAARSPTTPRDVAGDDHHRTAPPAAPAAAAPHRRGGGGQRAAPQANVTLGARWIVAPTSRAARRLKVADIGGVAVARTRLDGERPHRAGDTDRRQRRRVRAGDRAPRRGRAGRPACARRQDRQAAVGQQARDEDRRVAGQLLERDEPDLRRHHRRHAPRLRLPRRAAIAAMQLPVTS